MLIQDIYNNDKLLRENYQWITTLEELENINITTSEWKLEFILKVLKLWKYFWYTSFLLNQAMKDYQILEQIYLCKSYQSNKLIVWNALRNIIEWFDYELWIKKYNVTLIDNLLSWVITVEEFINHISEKNILVDWEIKWEEHIKAIYKFIWASWTVYTWMWIVSTRQYKTDDLIDIYNWYKWDNELYLQITKYILDNKEQVSKDFTNLRSALISAFSILLWMKEPKIVEYINKINNSQVTEGNNDETNLIDNTK